MHTLIVTVQDEKKKIAVDLEVPALLAVEKLRQDIVDTLNAYNPDLYLSAFSMELFSPRLRRILGGHETLAQAGVWNGDRLTLIAGRKF